MVVKERERVVVVMLLLCVLLEDVHACVPGTAVPSQGVGARVWCGVWCGWTGMHLTRVPKSARPNRANSGDGESRSPIPWSALGRSRFLTSASKLPGCCGALRVGMILVSSLQLSRAEYTHDA